MPIEVVGKKMAQGTVRVALRRPARDQREQ